MPKLALTAVLQIFLLCPLQRSNADENAQWSGITRNMGIIYFYRQNCLYCREQSKIFQSLKEKGWKNIKPVDVAAQPRLAAQYGVTVVPDVWLVANVDGEIKQTHISIGLITEKDFLEIVAAIVSRFR
jgi:hypothetical protein